VELALELQLFVLHLAQHQVVVAVKKRPAVLIMSPVNISLEVMAKMTQTMFGDC
jgi:hypothetical protein